ncbi:MAG: hypothetical protein DKM22_05600 [Candidatus Melainabacteria bacterium]|nr:MAG: hypothetical protein DKM22_05600 [Candidatus Melainabacteria bacterium]
MFITGVVVAIDSKNARVKLKIAEYDDFETGWFFTPQLCTVKDKSYSMLEVNTLVAACCSENFSDGCVIGAIYNDEDICILSDENLKYILFEDGTKIEYDKSTHKLNLDCKGKVTLKTPLATVNGNLNVVGNIVATGEVIDMTSSMSIMRGIYNSHVHSNGNAGASTGSVSTSM